MIPVYIFWISSSHCLLNILCSCCISLLDASSFVSPWGFAFAMSSVYNTARWLLALSVLIQLKSQKHLASLTPKVWPNSPNNTHLFSSIFTLFAAFISVWNALFQWFVYDLSLFIICKLHELEHFLFRAVFLKPR